MYVKTLSQCLFYWLILSVSLPLQALDIHYDEDRDTALKACDDQVYAGNLSESRQCYSALIDHKNTLVRAEAHWALGDTREANRLFRQAARIEENNPAVRTRWGSLYASTHQVSDALSLFNEALEIDSDYLPAKLATIRLTFQRFEGAVHRELEDILQTYPHSLEAHVLMARLALELKDTKAARNHLEAAENLATENGLPALEIYALLAAADLLDGKAQSNATEKSLLANPNYGNIYAIPAHFYIITFRYREAVALYRKAVEIEPELWPAHSALGINLLRINRIEEARKHLEIAYQGDPYDTATVNTLRLLDTLEGMQIIPMDVEYAMSGDETGNSENTRSVRIVLRLDKSEAAVLKPYLEDVVTKAVKTLSRRYNYHLERPLIVELYPNHDDFAVRTVSTPGVGLLGVTFGNLLAMDSPRAKPEGDFHWASVLWHELVHVYTLEASNHRLPRWFGEGLSVYEEWRTGPLVGRQLPINVLQAMSEDKFLPLADLDQGFIRPTYRGQITVSYMQAGLICDFIADEWGHNALVQILEQFSKGLDTESAVLTVLKIDTVTFDRRFKRSLVNRYDTVTKNLAHWRQLLRKSENLLLQEAWPEAEAAAREALAVLPEYVGPGNAYVTLAKLYDKTGRTDQSLDFYRQWLKRGGHNPGILRELVDAFNAQGETNDAIHTLATLNLVAPYSLESHQRLANLYLKEQQANEALREFDVVLALEPLDVAPVLLGKAKAHRQLGNNDESRRHVLYSLEQAPFYREAQHFLIDLIEGGTS